MQNNKRHGWSSRSIGSRLQHQFFYFLIRLGGYRLALFTASVVSGWYILMRPSIRNRGKPYISRRFPGVSLLSHLMRQASTFAQVLIDRAALGIMGTDIIDVHVRDSEKLQQLLCRDTGFILMNAHVGGWQVAMSALKMMQRPVNLVLTHEEGDVDRHYFEHGGDRPFNVINPEGFMGGVLEMTAALSRGEIVSVMGDRNFGDTAHSVQCTFLGDPAPFPVSGFRLAAATGAPIIVLLSHRTGPGAYELELADVIEIPKTLKRDNAGLKPFMERYVGLLEDYVEKHPYQFFNFFDMWSG